MDPYADNFPPARISDLKVRQTDSDRKEFTGEFYMEFTASGDDMTMHKGNCKLYLLHNSLTMSSNFLGTITLYYVNAHL